MLGLVVFSIVFGIVLGRMGDKGTPVKAFFETLNEVVMKMVTLVMWYVKHIVISSLLRRRSLGSSRNIPPPRKWWGGGGRNIV